MKICSIDDCESQASRRGWCNKHYSRWLRHGDPLYLSPKMSERGEPLRLLMEWIEMRDREKCWDDWPFGTSTEGRPQVGKSKRGSHVALELDGYKRPPFPYNNALHSCDNKLCINPDHLRWGTKEDNARDYAERWGYCPHCEHCNGD